MTAQNGTIRPDDSIEKALSEFREAWHSGKRLDPAEFCECHLECGPELREKIDDFLYVAEGLMLDAGDRNENEKPLGEEGNMLIGAGKILGDFRIIRKIGSGGMATVFEAEQISLQRKVAIKVLSFAQSLSERGVQRFRREAQAAGRQSHPGIVSIYEVGEHNGIHYIAQELIEGSYTLAKKLDEHRKNRDFPRGYFRRVARLFAGIADALQDSHSSGVFHRDITPSNILLTKDAQPKVTDFGLATVKGALPLTRTGELAGTYCYMSPEQTMSGRANIDHRTDVYSLGVVLYEALTLKCPFEGETSRELLEQIIFKEPPNPRKVNNYVPHDLEIICLKSMEKDPKHRYQTMRDLAEDLRRFLNGEVILAKPAGPATKIWKRVKRNPILAGLAGIAIVAVLAWIIISLPLYLRTIRAEKRAKEERDEKEKQLRLIEGIRLADQSSEVLPESPGLALLLAIESINKSPGLYANTALVEALQKCHEQKAFFHDDLVLNADFSPDGKRVIIASYDHTAKILDIETGRVILTFRGHEGAVRSAVFSKPDGQRVVTASSDHTARIWNAANGKEIRKLEGHEGIVTNATFSPDGKQVVTASYDKTARIWDATTGGLLKTLIGHTGFINTAFFNPTKKQVVTASSDKTARIWDTVTGTEITNLKGHERNVQSAVFSPDGQWVVTASSDHTARIWNSANGEEIRKLEGHKGVVRRAAFSQDGVWVATASDDFTSRIFNVYSGDEKVALKGHTSIVCSAAFDNFGSKLITASIDKTARIWNPWKALATEKIITINNQNESPILSATFSPDGKQLATTTKKGIIHVLNAETGKKVAELDGHRNFVNQVAFSHDSKKIVTASMDNTSRIWDAKTGNLLKILEGHSNFVNTACFSPDGRNIVTSSYDHTARIWDCESGKTIFTLKGHTGVVRTAVFSYDGKKIVTASYDNSARIWNAKTGDLLKKLTGHTEEVFSARFGCDNQRLVTASSDHTARIWEVATGKETVLKGHNGPVFEAFFSPDDEKVFTISMDCSVRVWNTHTGKEILTFKAPKAKAFAFSAAISPDGKKVIAVFGDRIARIYNSITGNEIALFKEINESCAPPVFRPDGEKILLSFTDKTVKILPIDFISYASDVRCF